MSAPKKIIIKETLQELKSLYKKATPFIAPRIRVLIELKKHEEEGISKRIVATTIGVDPNSVQAWRKLYEEHGIDGLCKHNKIGFKPSVFTKEEHDAIKTKLNDSKNGLRGYVELLSWIKKEFNKQIKYNTLLKYSIREFGSKVKVARKSHIKKDVEAVSTFKKTLLKSVKEPLLKKEKSIKR
jgi:transposase